MSSAAGGGPALGIDAGSSSARWLLLAADGEELGSGRVGPVSAIDLLREGDGGTAGAPGTASGNLRELLSQALAHGRPARVVAGVTGLEVASDDARAVGATISAHLGVPDAAVTVVPDVYLAYLGAFDPGDGILVYAGTGSVAIHLTARGEALRAGGHGYLIDDAGGAYWIGREALKLVLRRSDETGAPAAGRLAGALYAVLGGDSWPHIKHAVYRAGRSKVASLASAVSLAARRGDADAKAILAAAGTELARLGNVLTGRLGLMLPVALAGGVADAGEPLTDAFAAALSHGAGFRTVATPPVNAAATLAARLSSGSLHLPEAWG